MNKAKETIKLNIKTEQSGFTLISNNITRNTFLSDGAIRLYVYLKSHSDNFNISIKSIANYLKKSRETILREIKELKESGFLILEKKENKNCYFYKLYNSPKLERLKGFTKEIILNSFWNSEIDFNDLYELKKSGKIQSEEFKEILKEIQETIKTKWLDTEE